uniref:Uncharacterized protein n=1 Tax=Salix viminalis TaxID=40686 RepID=A0A6N2MLQ4_SALVM
MVQNHSQKGITRLPIKVLVVKVAMVERGPETPHIFQAFFLRRKFAVPDKDYTASKWSPFT